MNEMEAREERNTEVTEQEEQEMTQLNNPVPNILAHVSVIIMIVGFLLFTIPAVFFPFQAMPSIIGIQNVAQGLGLPILGIGLILFLVGLMRAGSTR